MGLTCKSAEFQLCVLAFCDVRGDDSWLASFSPLGSTTRLSRGFVLAGRYSRIRPRGLLSWLPSVKRGTKTRRRTAGVMATPLLARRRAYCTMHVLAIGLDMGGRKTLPYLLPPSTPPPPYPPQLLFTNTVTVLYCDCVVRAFEAVIWFQTLLCCPGNPWAAGDIARGLLLREL